VEIGVLAGHDRGDQPAAEAEAAHAIHPQRVARHLHDCGIGPGVAQPAQRPVQLHRRRRRQSVAGIVECAVAGAERAENPGPRTARVEQHAEDLAGARLPERSREPDDPQRLGRRSVEARGQPCERVPGRIDPHDRHLSRHVTRPLGDDCGCAPRDRVSDVRVPILRAAGHGDEEHAGHDAAAVLGDAGDVGIGPSMDIEFFSEPG
jgi:hypothetical protein